MEINLDEFMTALMEQLYRNREKFEDKPENDEHYFFEIMMKHVGHLAASLSVGDWKRVMKECMHVGAVIFEIFVRAAKR